MSYHHNIRVVDLVHNQRTGYRRAKILCTVTDSGTGEADTCIELQLSAHVDVIPWVNKLIGLHDEAVGVGAL